jgi:hypothetical protein
MHRDQIEHYFVAIGGRHSDVKSSPCRLVEAFKEAPKLLPRRSGAARKVGLESSAEIDLRREMARLDVDAKARVYPRRDESRKGTIGTGETEKPFIYRAHLPAHYRRRDRVATNFGAVRRRKNIGVFGVE